MRNEENNAENPQVWRSTTDGAQLVKQEDDDDRREER